jgi:hypothetical protein
MPHALIWVTAGEAVRRLDPTDVRTVDSSACTWIDRLESPPRLVQLDEMTLWRQRYLHRQIKRNFSRASAPLLVVAGARVVDAPQILALRAPKLLPEIMRWIVGAACPLGALQHERRPDVSCESV